MAEQNNESGSWEKPLGEFITAFVLLTHAIVFFQLVICSKNMVVSFNIPTKNIGIYLGKLSGIRSLLMSVGGAAEYGIFNITKVVRVGNEKTIRQSVSVFSLTCLTLTRLIFLIFLYYPETASFRNYIVLIIGAFFVGSFQISAFSLTPEFSALSWLSVYLSGILSFVIQVILDMCWSKRPSLTFKIQSWISLILSFISVGLWPYNLFFLTGTQTQATKPGTDCPQASAATQSPSVSSSSSGAESSAPGGAGPAPASTPAAPSPSMEYVMSLTSLTVLKIMTNKLTEICSQLSPESVLNVEILITRLEQIRSERDISYEVLVAIDLVILGLKKCQSSENQLCLLAELSLFLRIKVMVKQEQELLARKKRSLPEQHQSLTGPRSRTRRQTPNGGCTENQKQTSTGSSDGTSILYSISPFLMFGAGSLVKDFLFPGVIPYGLLERDKCHLINLIVIIFLSVGPVTVFFINKYVDEFKSDHKWIHLFWSCMIPKIIIFFISLSAIHTKQSWTHQIRSSRWRVFLMAMILLTCYGFLETVNIVGVPNIAKTIFPDLIPINNICGKFVRYFVYKLSVGYNKTRVNVGFTLPNFQPPEPIPNAFGFWCKGAFSNGWKDLKSDFRMNIKQYLEVAPTVSKKSPIETLRYCDIFM